MIEDTPAGKRQRYWHDFFNYAGIHRTVWLYATDPTHITDVTITTDLDGDNGVIGYAVEAEAADDRRDKGDLAGRRRSRGRNDTPDRAAHCAFQTCTSGPQETATFTILRFSSIRGDTVVDSYHQSVGVRTVKVDGIRFLINGEPFYFTGFGKHEDLPVIGKGHNDAYLVHDFELLKWIGANSFRTSHYPYSEDVLDYADRHGIVIIDETAAVGLNMGLGGGIFGGQGYQTFSPETANDATREVHAQAIRELIARDKNHPSVVLWSIANEPESDTEEAEKVFPAAVRRGP